MKKEIILQLFFISVLLFACSKEETPNLPQIEYGRFRGDIGRYFYDLINDKLNERTSTTHFDGKNFQFQFNSDSSSPSIIGGSIYEVNQILTVNLVEPLNTPSFLFFETYKGSKNYIENWITVDSFEQRGDKKTEKFYTTVKEKQSINVDILSVTYKELKTPSLKGRIKGYLYNVENKEDSILINATFTTQAAY